MKESGVFYGVGIGPGDPGLMTLNAVRVLKKAPVIAIPKSTEAAGPSQALSIVNQEIDLAGKETLELLFPMTKDKSVLKASRVRAATDVAERLKKGEDVAFITLGDPMLYSTFSYLVPLVTEALPGIKVSVVPGITSFSAAASRVVTPLAESDERVIIIPAAYNIEVIKPAIESYDTIVIMKVNKVFDRLFELLVETGLDKKAFFASRVGWPEEEFTTDLQGLYGKKLDYFSMVIINKR